MAGVTLHAGTQALNLPLAFLPRGARRGRRLAILLLQVRQLTPDSGVFEEIAVLAGHCREVTVQRLLGVAHLACQADHRAVGLELRERRLQDLPRAVTTKSVNEVDCHVVRGAKTGV